MPSFDCGEANKSNKALVLAVIKKKTGMFCYQFISLAVKVFWTLISPINKHLGVQAIRPVSSHSPKDTDINFHISEGIDNVSEQAGPL